MPTSGSLNYDASITNEKRSVRIYKDLNLNFNTNVVTKDIAKLSDVEAINRSVRYLVQLNDYEKQVSERILKEICIRTYEPRVELLRVDSFPDLDRNAYDVRIEFFIVNAPAELVALDVLLERVR